MNKAVKTFALSAISVALLSGCILEDKYEDSTGGGSGGGGGSVTANFRIYGWGNNNDTDFDLYALGQGGNPIKIQRDDVTTGTADNIKVEWLNGEGSAVDSPIKVTISEDAPGSIIAKADHNYNYSATDTNGKNGKGTARARIFPQSMPEEGKRITIEVPGSEPLDITELYSTLYAGTGEQWIKIPLFCFEGANLTTGTTPFKITSESNLVFGLKDVALRSNTYTEAFTYDCTLNNEASGATAYARDEEGTVTGWASNVSGFSVTNDGSQGPSTVTIDDTDYHGHKLSFGGNGNAGLHFTAPKDGDDDVFVDLSANGDAKLRFNMIVDNYAGALPDFQIKMTGEKLEHEKTEDGTWTGVSTYETADSAVFTIEADTITKGKVTEVEVSLEELFAGNAAGQMLVNLPRNIRRMTIQGQGGSGDTYKGMTMHISDIKFVK